jgi:aromatic-amino-acid transaminase
MAAVTRLLTDPALSAAVRSERAGLVNLLGERVAAFNREAQRAGLAYPRYDGGFFATVFTPEAQAVGERLRREGVFVVPVDGGVRLGLCAVPASDVPALVGALAAAM